MSRTGTKTLSGETFLELYQLTVDGPSFLNGEVTIGTSATNANTIMNGNLLVTGTINGGSLVGVAAVTASAPVNSTGGSVPNISILPGTDGQVLTTILGAPAWATPASGGGTVTSVAATVPSFLTITGSPVTTTGTLAIAYNPSTALPAANGGTGLTTVGTNGQVLTVSAGAPAWATPTATVTAVTGSGNIASSGGLTPNITFTGTLATTNGGTGLNTVGTNGQVLTISAGAPAWATPASGGTVTSVAATVPSFLTITGSPVTTTGTLAIAYNPSTALPAANGGTGLTTVGTNGQVLTVSAGAPAWATPTPPVTAVTGSGNIASSGGLTPNITFTGTLATTNGGTGLNTVGTNGQVLTISAGAPAWTTPGVGGTVTSVAATVPSFLTITGSPVTTTGTLAIAYNPSTALPAANGGTGLTTVGTNGQVLTVSAGAPAWITPTAPVTAVTGSGNIASSGGLTPNITFTGTLATTNGGTGLNTVGTNGQVLTVSAGAPAWITPTPPVTAVTGSGNIASSGGLTPNITFTGTLATTNGGTGLNTVGTNGQVLTVSAGAPAWATPTPPVTAVTGSGNIASSGGLTPNITFTGTLATTNGGTGLNTVGTNGQVLTISAGVPAWTTPASGGTVNSVTASTPLASSGGVNPNISITSSIGTGAVVLATSPTITTPSIATINYIPLNDLTLQGQGASHIAILVGGSIDITGRGGATLTMDDTLGTFNLAAQSATVAAGMQGTITLYGSLTTSKTGGGTGNLSVSGTTTLSADCNLSYSLAGPTTISNRNTNSASSSFTQFKLQNDTANGCYLFLNSSGRSFDGGVNTATLRNDAGTLILACSGSTANIALFSTTAQVTGNLTVSGTSLHTGRTTVNSFIQLQTYSSIAYAATLTFTAAQFAGGLIRVTGASAACTITTDTAANLAAQFGSTAFTAVRVRFSYTSTAGARTMNFVGGTGVTIFDSRNSAQNSTSIIEIVISSASAADVFIN